MHKNINVLYIITKLELGGAQKVCLSLFEGMQNSGQKALLLSGPEGVLVDKVKDMPNVILLKDFKREVSWSLFTEIKFFFELVIQIKKIKKQYPDLIVHTHSTKAGILGRWAAFFAGIKKRIHTIHGYAFHEHQNKIIWFVIYFMELLTSLITTHFVCVSSNDIQTGKKLFPNFKKKYSLIRAAVDERKFICARKTELSNNINKQFIFGAVACFKKQKNLIDLFKAFKNVYEQNNDCILEVIGDGILRPELENWIAENNLKNKIILHGWQENVAQFMINWDAFVLSSLWEGLPCAIIEARLLKLPVLAYNAGGIHDVIFHGQNGFLYKLGDWGELAKGMLKLSQDKTLYTKLKHHKDNLLEFTNDYMIKKHINLYQK